MRKKFLFGLILCILGVVGITLVLASEHALVFHPRGMIAKQELILIITNIFLMWVIIIPTYILLFVVVWKYCLKKAPKYDPEHSTSLMSEILMWGLPSIVVVIMSVITWNATHALNPYKPIESDVKPLNVEVVALDWKWLFIYPELGIATLNYLHIPEKTPIQFRLTADNTPMNSFWIPQLSGQIYSMTGMATQLHLIADGIGKYTGRAVEINGEGYADMWFNAESSSQENFEKWVNEVKASSKHLTKENYLELAKPFIDRSIIYYSDVEKDLFHNIMHPYMYPTGRVI
jgi:cytochrome o ubiquinol oxidase subunit 2